MASGLPDLQPSRILYCAYFIMPTGQHVGLPCKLIIILRRDMIVIRSISSVFVGELEHLQFPCSFLSVLTSRSYCHLSERALVGVRAADTFWWRPVLLRLHSLPSMISMIQCFGVFYQNSGVSRYPGIRTTFYPDLSQRDSSLRALYSTTTNAISQSITMIIRQKP